MDIEAILRKTDLFADCDGKIVRKVARQGKIKSYSKNSALFFENDIGSALYILIDGSIRLYKSSPDGKEVTVHIIPPGEMFAEVVLFESDHYPVNAVFLGKSKVFEIAKLSFLEMLEDNDFRNDFIAALMRKKRYLTKRLLYLTTYDVEERFFRFLAEKHGKRSSYSIAMSKKDFAAAIGTIPETFSRLTMRLKERGIITWENKTIYLQDNFWDNHSYYLD